MALGKRLLQLVAGLVLPLLVGCDHVTKRLAVVHLQDGPRELVPRVLELRYAENRDVAFNILRWIPEHIRYPTLVVFGIVVTLGLASFLMVRRPQRKLELAALCLITGGAIGNVADRLFRGYVVDFIHLTHWPVFNLADVYLTMGIGLLLLATWLGQRAGERPI